MSKGFRASFLKYAGVTLIREQAADCSKLEKALIASHFVLVSDHYEHPDPDVPFACTPSKSNTGKGYFFAGYEVGEGLDSRVDELNHAVKQAVGEGAGRHVADVRYSSNCLLVRYSFAFDDASLSQKNKILEIASGVNEKVKTVLGSHLKKEVQTIEPSAAYSQLVTYLKGK